MRRTNNRHSVRLFHSAENKFERFRGFLELISRIRISAVAEMIFFERFEFVGVFKSSITHNVAVHVLVLWTVCAHTIPFRMLWCL